MATPVTLDGLLAQAQTVKDAQDKLTDTEKAVVTLTKRVEKEKAALKEAQTEYDRMKAEIDAALSKRK